MDDVRVDIWGEYLKDKSIALCVSGGIAAIEAPKVARALRRYGAHVRAYMTNETQKFVGKAALEWGTDNEVIDMLSGRAEHICKEDLVLVCPATLNTINKIFAGIADNPVTTLAASALASKPIYIVPTMHGSLYNNPVLKNNLAHAPEYGVHVIPGRESEGKQKMPQLENIVAEICKELSSSPLKGKKLLITGGPTPVKIDSTRIITNIFKGKLAVEIANQAYLQGANVTLLLGDTGIHVPSYIRTIRHHDYDEYATNVFAELEKGYDAGIFSAAVADYKPTTYFAGKLPSKGGLTELRFVETPKIINQVRARYPKLHMTTFKHECNISVDELLDIGRKRLQDYQAVVVNREEDMRDGHAAYIVTPGQVIKADSKKDIAREVLSTITL